MSYCINPRCLERQNPEGLERCHYCGTELLINGQYRIVRPLRTAGPLGVSEVFIVQRDGTPKIMKVLLPQNRSQVERLEREALVLQLFQHPGIPFCAIDDYFIWKPANAPVSFHCLVEELIEGQDLEQWLSEQGRASQEQILEWLYQLAEILKVLHTGRVGQGHLGTEGMALAGYCFVHCDIKPENVILRPDGRVALVDFGFVTPVGDGTGSVTLGSAGYIAPEQANGMPVVQSDFYSLGRSMVHLATGLPLNTLANDSQTGRLLWRDFAPQIEQPVADLLDCLVAPVLGLRPQTDQAILDALAKIPGQIKRMRRRKVLRSRPAIAFYSIFLILFGFAVQQGATNYMAGVYYRWGLQDQGNGLLEDSMANLKKSIKLDPGNAEAHDSLGLTCQELGDNISAVKSFHRAIELDQTLWTAHYNLGNLFDDQEIYNEAQKEYVLAMQYSPKNTALPINNLARLKNLAKDYEAAKKLSLQGLNQTEERFQKASLYKNLGWAYLGMGDYKTAQKRLQRSIDLASDRADAFCLLAKVNNALGEVERAKSSAQKCLLLNSENTEVQEWRNEILEPLF